MKFDAAHVCFLRFDAMKLTRPVFFCGAAPILLEALKS